MASLDTKKSANSNGEILPTETPKVMSKGRIIKNLVMLNVGYLLLFSPYIGLTTLQSTLNSVGNVGVISQSAVYVSFLSTALFLPRLVSIKFGLKIAIVFAHFAFLPYIAGNLYPTIWLLVPSAVLAGFGVGTLWISISAYINGLSYLYAGEDTDKAKPITVMFFGIFYVVFNACLILGNLISFVVLQPTRLNSIVSNFTLVIDPTLETPGSPKVSCGADFCGGIDRKLNLPSQETRFTLIGIDLSLSVLSVLITSFFVDSLKIERKGIDSNDSVYSKLISSLKQMVKIDQLLLIGITIYCAFQAGFMFCDFTEAFVGCAWGLEYVGLVSMIFAAASALMCAVQSCLSKFIPRFVLIAIAMMINIGVSVLLLNWDPSSDHFSTMYLVAGFWGLADGIWNTQLTAFYGVIFRDEQEAAFANYRLWESLGLMLSFVCNSLICTSSKIYMQITVVAVGYVGYLIVELRAYLRKKTFTVTKVQ